MTTISTDMNPAKSTLTGNVPCNVCGADDATVVFEPGVAQINGIVRCNHCGLMYASPRVNVDQVRLETGPEDLNWDLTAQVPQRFEKEQLQIRDFTRSRKLLNELHPNRGKFVELGSSMGFLLQAFKEDGWDVLGVDPDRDGCRVATQRLGLPTIPTTLEAADLPDESADVVVMLHVIEHLPDPVGTLSEIHRILKPGGHLVMETPRYDTPNFKLLGRRERSVSCDGHIYFFTTDSLRKAYTKAGFDLVRLDYVGRSLTIDRLAYNLGVMTKVPAIQRGLIAMARRLKLNKAWIHLNLRDMQRVCLVKR
ncbi:class I SAM-dependent methyltransferase [Tundrisphaera sp. TA3]|uniref:class I SAM-dependent methyltransferase n=1 Tax=Tundrisphaera sp. TA3 TaxID=3435775 RepID=UPI003EBB124B